MPPSSSLRSSTGQPEFPELLVPAGNREKLDTALLYGADAVYLGGKSMNLRASAQGFSAHELEKAVDDAHRMGVRVYYCLNSLPMERDLKTIPSAVEEAAAAGVDGLIIADPGVFRMARKVAAHIPVHISTQANTANSESLAFWHDLGAARVNLAREMSARDIHAALQAMPGMETEVFIHGAMCLAVSGKCLMSAWLNNRPANMGRCTHPCRFEYRQALNPEAIVGTGHAMRPPFSAIVDAPLAVEEKTRPGQAMWHVSEGGPDEEGYSSIWAPEDLCLMPYLPWFVQNRVTALKIEGRMKGAGYVAHVADAYKAALTCLRNGTAGFDFRRFMPDLFQTASRPLGTGFFLPERRRNLNDELAPPTTGHALIAKLAEPLGNASWIVEVRGRWRADEPVEVMFPGMRRIRVLPAALETCAGERADTVHSGTRAVLHLQDKEAALFADEGGLVPGLFLRTAMPS